MQITKNSFNATVSCLFLLFAIVVSLVVLPTVNAQATMRTYCYIGALPNPAGVGQEVLLHVGITLQLSSSEMGWEGLSITITKPDGSTETISNIRTDSTGGTGRIYVPPMPGNYTLQAHFPEQVTTTDKSVPGVAAGTRMLASTSAPLTLIVHEEPAPIYPPFPLPTEYWTRPIDAQQREWAAISGSWLFWSPRNLFVPYNEAPETAHILWAKPLTTGGLVGGALGNIGLEALGYHAFEEGDAYEGKWGPRFSGPVIIAGKLYYEKYASPDIYKETVCVDIRTGEQLWSRVLLNNLTFTRGQLMYWDTYDYHGVYDYLWATGDAATRAMLGIGTATSSWHAFDPFTGDYVYTLHSLPTATATEYGPKGEILIYTVDLTRGWITMWNSTNIPALYASTVYASMGWGQWRPMGKIVNATGPHGVTFRGQPYSPTTLQVGNLTGYQWNKTIPMGLPGSVWAIFPEDKMVGSSITSTAFYLWCVDLRPGREGQLLYNKTWKAPAEWLEGNISISRGAISAIDGVCTLWAKETTKNYGFSIETGEFLWETASEHYLNNYVGTVRHIAYGRLFSAGVSGIVYCYDVKTGKLLWEYHAEDPYTEILWANDWWMRTVFITDGKIYLGHLEHSPVDPKPRGAPFICLNATTGEVIFRINGAFRLTYWGGGPALIGDSTIAVMDTYDQRVYAIGKGPSAISVTAGPEVSVHGSKVLVKGYVTDVSPGTKSAALQLRFPNGVPAVADECMSDWMLYVYKQFPRPADVKGVEVVISVLDPNNNCYEVGRTRSDDSGFFKLSFLPPVPGEYTIIATFQGSKAYYGSFAKTALFIEEAPPPVSPPPTPPPQAPVETYFALSTIVIVVAIVIIGVLLLRKKP
ncbi:MAG: PQQ-binding-like beta-propeller repeat protein [Candidatus Bathyarchaeia archaeon]